MSERTAVLLRLSPELLERIDQRRGAMKRTPWLAEVIASHLDDLDRGDEGRDPGAQFGSLATRASAGLFERTVRDEDGTDLGLKASRRDDGVLDIAAADAESSPPRPEQGPDRPLAAVGGNPGEIPVDGSGGLGPDPSAFEDIP